MSPDRLHSQYTLTVEVLSPLHIGSGNELLRDYDYAVRGGRTWVINQDALLEAALGAGDEFDNTLLTRPAAELLQPEDFREDSGFFRYVMPGEPVNRPLSEQIKNVWGYPYLPGSSVKGAIRTATMWGIYTAEMGGQVPGMGRLGDKRRFAAQPLERALFAPRAESPREAPNMDIFRALHVADSAPVGNEALYVTPVQIYPTTQDEGSAGLNVDVEAIKPGTVFQTTLTIEEYGFEDDRARGRLGWNSLRERFDRLPSLGQRHAGQRIADEVDFHKAKDGPDRTLAFYAQMVKHWQQLGESQWLTQIGWGAAWDSKTLGSLLRTQGAAFDELIQRYGLKGRGEHRPGDMFPSTRNLALYQGTPALPMGWVRCTLAPA